jgi:arginyl-tRNA synthetase
MIEKAITQLFVDVFKNIFGVRITTSEVKIQKTRPDIEGDFTINIFPFVRASRQSADGLANTMGHEMLKQMYPNQNKKRCAELGNLFKVH